MTHSSVRAWRETSGEITSAAVSLSAPPPQWESLLENHDSLIRHTLERMGGNQDEIRKRHAFVLERLARDDFWRLGAHLPSIPSQFSAWLSVVVHRLGKEHSSWPDSRVPHLSALLAKHLRISDHRTLETALDQLPAPDRLLLKLRFELGLPLRRISTLMDLPGPGHIRHRCNELCRVLRQAP